MENHPLRVSLGRWAAAFLQASPRLALAIVGACSAGAAAPPRPAVPRLPPEEIVVRTTSFAFRMGARVDEAWPARADETRAALGGELTALLEEEDITVPLLARQLGVTWPDEPLAFDVAMGPPGHVGPCDAEVPRLLHVARQGPPPAMFFACVLGRGFVRLAEESPLFRAIGARVRSREDAARLYACVVGYAVAATLAASRREPRTTRLLEQGLGERCTPAMLDWLGREWVKRVRDEESAAGFGARAAEAQLGPH